MRQTFLVLAFAGALALPQAAQAQSRTTLGVGSGAVAGALVAGPIGAVAGAVVGGFVGSSSEGRRRRHIRRTRHHAGPARVRTAQAPQRRAEAGVPRVTGSTAPRSAATWKDPR